MASSVTSWIRTKPRFHGFPDGFALHHSPKPHPAPDFGSFLNIELSNGHVLRPQNEPTPMFICKSEKSPLKTRIKRWDAMASLVAMRHTTFRGARGDPPGEGAASTAVWVDGVFVLGYTGSQTHKGQG